MQVYNSIVSLCTKNVFIHKTEIDTFMFIAQINEEKNFFSSITIHKDHNDAHIRFVLNTCI